MKKISLATLLVLGSVGTALGISGEEQALRDKVDACVQANCPQDQSCLDQCIANVQAGAK